MYDPSLQNIHTTIINIATLTIITSVGASRGSTLRPSGPWWRKEKEPPPKLDLGTKYIEPLR